MNKPVHPFDHLTPIEEASIALTAIRLFHNWKLPGTMRSEVERVCDRLSDELEREPEVKLHPVIGLEVR